MSENEEGRSTGMIFGGNAYGDSKGTSTIVPTLEFNVHRYWWFVNSKLVHHCSEGCFVRVFNREIRNSIASTLIEMRKFAKRKEKLPNLKINFDGFGSNMAIDTSRPKQE